MGKVNFSEEFKRDAVAQITERGYSVSILEKFPEIYLRTLSLSYLREINRLAGELSDAR